MEMKFFVTKEAEIPPARLNGAGFSIKAAEVPTHNSARRKMRTKSKYLRAMEAFIKSGYESAEVHITGPKSVATTYSNLYSQRKRNPEIARQLTIHVRGNKLYFKRVHPEPAQ